MKYSNPLLVIVLTLFFNFPSWSQCQGDFTFKAFPSDKSGKTGKIELTASQPTSGSYVFKVYKISGEIILVSTKETFSPSIIKFEGLEPAEYFIKVEWSQCQKTIGGLEGIIVNKKD